MFKKEKLKDKQKINAQDTKMEQMKDNFVQLEYEMEIKDKQLEIAIKNKAELTKRIFFIQEQKNQE